MKFEDFKIGMLIKEDFGEPDAIIIYEVTEIYKGGVSGIVLKSNNKDYYDVGANFTSFPNDFQYCKVYTSVENDFNKWLSI